MSSDRPDCQQRPRSVGLVDTGTVLIASSAAYNEACCRRLDIERIVVDLTVRCPSAAANARHPHPHADLQLWTVATNRRGCGGPRMHARSGVTVRGWPIATRLRN